MSGPRTSLYTLLVEPSIQKDNEIEGLKQKEKRVELLILLNQILFSIRTINSLTKLLHLSSQENEIIAVRELNEKILNIRVEQINLINDHILDYNHKKLNYKGLNIYTNPADGKTTFEFYQEVFKGINNFEDALTAYCINTPKEKALLYKERLMRFYKPTLGDFTNNKLKELDNLISNRYFELKKAKYLSRPKLNFKITDEYIRRILEGVTDYNEALNIFTYNLSYSSMEKFWVWLVAKGIISEDFSKDTLINDIKKVKK